MGSCTIADAGHHGKRDSGIKATGSVAPVASAGTSRLSGRVVTSAIKRILL